MCRPTCPSKLLLSLGITDLKSRLGIADISGQPSVLAFSEYIQPWDWLSAEQLQEDQEDQFIWRWTVFSEVCLSDPPARINPISRGNADL